MWTATWALNTLVACGKSTDWMVHMLGQAVGGYTNATHGDDIGGSFTFRIIVIFMPYGLEKFKRVCGKCMGRGCFGKRRSGNCGRRSGSYGKLDEKSWGLVMNLSELGGDRKR